MDTDTRAEADESGEKDVRFRHAFLNIEKQFKIETLRFDEVRRPSSGLALSLELLLYFQHIP